MIKELITNQVFISVIITIAICEVLKFIDASVRKKKIDLWGLISTGGMPSSHATFVCSIAISIGIVEGFVSTIFFLSAGLAIVVVRDAFGVRRDVDKLAKTVNRIIEHGKLSMEGIMKITGHTPVQVVVGSLIGIAGPIIINLFY